MNCFNIRELQGILKRKFFTDLIDSHDYKILLKSSMVSLRYKLNSDVNLDFDTAIFYKFGTHSTGSNKSTIFSSQVNTTRILSSKDTLLLGFFFNDSIFFSYFNSLLFNAWVLYSRLVFYVLTIISNFKFSNLVDSLSIFKYMLHTFSSNFFNFFLFDFVVFNKNNFLAKMYPFNVREVSYNILDNNTIAYENNINSFSDMSNSQRFVRFNNSLINYDYKTGNYIGN